jgi:dTDP-4-dehydrorhamnose 3,5-epimerase-like enzyme
MIVTRLSIPDVLLIEPKVYGVPEGFTHGFIVLSENAEFLYKTSESQPILAAKDALARRLVEAEVLA